MINPRYLHDLLKYDLLPGFDMYYIQDLGDVDRDLSDLSDLSDLDHDISVRRMGSVVVLLSLFGTKLAATHSVRIRHKSCCRRSHVCFAFFCATCGDSGGGSGYGESVVWYRTINMYNIHPWADFQLSVPPQVQCWWCQKGRCSKQ